jgi:exonuclease VII small subunit
MTNTNDIKMQQDQYAANRAFLAYQEAVEAWSRASVELDKAHDRMEEAAKVLRTFMNTAP